MKRAVVFYLLSTTAVMAQAPSQKFNKIEILPGPQNLILGTRPVTDFLPGIAPDGTATLIPGVTIGRVRSGKFIPSPEVTVNAADYGMVCDGVADAGPGLREATAFAAGLGGREVVMPPGVCRLLTASSPPSNTRWNGRGLTTFYLDPAMTTTGSLQSGIAFENVSGVSIDGISFKGAGTATLPSNSRDGYRQGVPRVSFLNVDGISIQNSAFRDFGNNTTFTNAGGEKESVAYIHGLIAFASRNILVDNTNFINNSGDGASFSNQVKNVEVRASLFDGNGDSALVCTIGGSNHRYHGNYTKGQSGNASPIIVMDRCNNWQVTANQVVGVPNAQGNLTGQGIRVARYPVDLASGATSTDFVIANNTATDVALSYSVENAGSVQGSTAVPGGGRFSVTGNTATNTYTCVSVSDSEVGTVSGNACSGVRDTGLVLVAYAGNTGSITVGPNTFNGKVTAGSFGVRQLVAGGTITPSTIAAQLVTGFATPYALANGNTPMLLPQVTRAANDACTPGQINVTADGSSIQACKAFGDVRRLPLLSADPFAANDNGFAELPGGLTLQWGTGPANGVITLPRACPTRLVSVTATPYVDNPANGLLVASMVNTPTTTGFTVASRYTFGGTTDVAGGNVLWQAICR